MRSTLIDRLVLIALILVPICFGLFSLSLGQDTDWDLRNYHWYNPYAFLHGRLMTDLGVAYHATFYNPLLDVPTYLAGSALPARVMGFLLGCVHGLNFVLVFVLADMLLADAAFAIPPAARRGAAAVIALVGVLGGGHLSIVGAVFNDNVVSLVVFAGVAIILRRRAGLFAPGTLKLARPDILPLLGAGALIGVATGLKLPTAVFAVGFCLALLCVGGAIMRRVALAFTFGCGVVVGFAVADGPWMVALWRGYGNPLFPYFNALFRSPMALPASYRDMRFIPDSLTAVLAHPFLMSTDPSRVGEIYFRDYRIATAYAVILITAVIAAFPRRQPANLAPAVRYLIAAAVLSYVPWVLMFGVYRYVIPLEMLAPLITVCLLAAWPIPLQLRRVSIVVVLALLTATTRRGDWGHGPWQQGPFVTAAVSSVERPEDALAIVTGNEPGAWVIPSFPAPVPFVRIQGFLNYPGQPKNGLNDRAHAIIGAHQGAFYLLFPRPEAAGATASLAAYNLRADFASCRPILSNLGDEMRWCRVYRSDQAAIHPEP